MANIFTGLRVQFGREFLGLKANWVKESFEISRQERNDKSLMQVTKKTNGEFCSYNFVLKKLESLFSDSTSTGLVSQFET